jgi:hypothetical protein
MIEINYKLFLAGISTILVGHFIHYTLKIYFLRQKYRHIPGPPADGIFGFFFGNILEIKSNNNKLLLNKVAEWLEIKH